MPDEFMNSRGQIRVSDKDYSFVWLGALDKQPDVNLLHLPYSIRILLEAVLRHYDGKKVSRQDVLNLATWKPKAENRPPMPFFPGRVLLQDFTGVPVVADLASMRSAYHRLEGDPRQINPVIPVDLVIDHSVQVDYYGTPDAFRQNAELEYERNRERYEFLHWAQKAFKNFKVVPPATGIVHQVNIEYLAQLVLVHDEDGNSLAIPDTLVGTDSHTTMVNGLGVVGWGVGGIEAISAMLGEPIEMLIPDVIGFKLTGKLREGVTPTDLTLTITQMLRNRRVVDKFVEFYGPGLDHLSLADRAMIANMSPENGATITYFPVDAQTLEYMRQTGRSPELVELIQTYYQKQGLFRSLDTPDPDYTDLLELDLGDVEPSLAGPKRPQDRVALSQVKESFRTALVAPRSEGGFAVKPEAVNAAGKLKSNGGTLELRHGAVAIAAITSCTNTSNPSVMIGAGLLARKAKEKGLEVPAYVKTSLSPGSRVVTDYLEKANLLQPLADLGFDIVGYGCMTCIGNSGPVPAEVAEEIAESNIIAAAVLSGNRNFEGRINPVTQANYLASPPLVVAYALAGTVDIDLATEPVGQGSDGQPVYLRDIWPSLEEIQASIRQNVTPEMFRQRYSEVYTGNPQWNAIESQDSPLFDWTSESTYIQEPPYFAGLSAERPVPKDILNARVLVKVGDSITTDHISPAGAIPVRSPAGEYLQSLGVEPKDFNSFGSRRGNDRVMTRGTFGNIRLKNMLLPEVEGNHTLYFPTGEQMSIYDAAVRYQQDGTPLVVLAGKEYGTGSSRDWAAKGTYLLGVRAVIAESYERIHRSNLVQMGVLPLQFKLGQGWRTLGLTGRETINIPGIRDHLEPGREFIVHAEREDGSDIYFDVIARVDTPIELEYYFNGGILRTVIYNLLNPKTD